VNVADLKGVRKAVVTVAPDTGMARVVSVMRQNNVGALVVSPDGRTVTGIVTERDIVRAVGATWPAPVNQTASQLMSSPVRTCAPGDRLQDVMETMLSRRVRHLPLVEGGALVGMVSMGDVVRSVVDQARSESNILRDMYIRASVR
jgi:CBS domain-containing protein